MIPLPDALQRWHDKRTLLIDTITSYKDACATLEESIDICGPESRDPASIEDVIADLHRAWPSLDSCTEQLASSRFIVNRVCNRPKELVPLNMLPPEIFLRVISFVLCQSDCAILHDRNRDEDSEFELGIMTTLQLVCSQWRLMILNTPSCWSHVDVLCDRETYESEPTISAVTINRLKRSAGIPIHLHFDYSTGDNKDEMITSFLKPYWSQVTSLDIRASSSKMFLAISEAYTTNRLSLASETTIPTTDAPRFHKILRRLPLVYPRGIVHLNIGDYGENLPHSSRIMAMLSNSPWLRSLRIHQMPFFDMNGLEQSQVIHLPHLELLGYPDFTDYGFLSKIEAGTRGLDLRLSVPKFEEGLHVVQSFLQRSNIKSLTLDSFYGHNETYLRECISSASSARAVFVKTTNPTWIFISKTFLIDDPKSAFLRRPEEAIPRFPQLKLIGLTQWPNWDGPITEQLGALVNAYSLDTLVLAGPEEPKDPLCSKRTNTISKHVKSLIFVRKPTTMDGIWSDTWDLFMDDQLKLL